MKIRLPDYENCIAGITSSVLKHYKSECNVKSLPVLDELLKNNYKNIVVILYDGLGLNILNNHLKRGDFLFDKLHCGISSVFPPTTAAATTSLLTGTLPVEHAWLGWSLYFREIDKNVCIFPNTLQGTANTPAADYNVAKKYIPYESVYEKIHKATDGIVSVRGLYPFGENGFNSPKEMFDKIKALCEKDGKNFIYAYLDEPDATIHKNGTKHSVVAEMAKHFNRLTEKLCMGLKNTLVIITADHGIIDTKYKFMTDYPHICECLKRPHSIESRALSLFIKEEKHAFFEQAFKQEFGNDFILYTGEEALYSGLFGIAPPHPRVTDFLGDYLAVATGITSIDNSRPTYRKIYKGMHAGLTEDEMLVPLILAECL